MNKPYRTRIKFCGLTRVQDLRMAADLAVDAVGLVFVPQSPRCVSIAQAMDFKAAMPPMLSSVALFMNQDVDTVQTVIYALRPSLLQFHGEESNEFCLQFGIPYLKAIPMASPQSAAAMLSAHPEAAGYILDGHRHGEAGGQGRGFDWQSMPRLERPWLLAGGLQPETVAEAISQCRPWGVDVASGIESAPGVKDPQRMQTFINEVRRADQRDI